MAIDWPMVNNDNEWDSTSEREVGSQSSYADTQRGGLMDFGSQVWRSLGEAFESSGRGQEVFGLSKTGGLLRDAGSWIKGTEFAKPDVDEYLGQEGMVKKFTRDITDTVVNSVVPAMTAAGAGAVVSGGNPFVMGAAATAQVITQFGGGTYSHSMEEGEKKGLVGDDLHSYSLNKALWEVIPELGSDAITVMSAGLLGPLAKGGKAAIVAGLKSGTLKPQQVIASLASVESKRLAGAKIAGASLMEGASEVVTSHGQAFEETRRGFEAPDTNDAYTFLLGATVGGGMTAIGKAKTQMDAKAHATSLEKMVNSETEEMRLDSIKTIYDEVLPYDKEQAENFVVYAHDKVMNNAPIELTKDFKDILSGAKDIELERKENIEANVEENVMYKVQAERSRIYTKESNQASPLLDGRSPAEVLKNELDSALSASADKHVADGIAQIEAIGEETAEAIPGVVIDAPVTPELEQAEMDTRMYRPELPEKTGEEKAKADAEKMPKTGEIKAREGDAYDRTREYFLMDKKLQEKVHGKARVKAVEKLADGPEKTAIVDAMVEVQEKKESLREGGAVTQLVERNKVIKEIDKAEEVIAEKIATGTLTDAQWEGVSDGVSQGGDKAELVEAVQKAETPKEIKEVVKEVVTKEAPPIAEPKVATKVEPAKTDVAPVVEKPALTPQELEMVGELYAENPEQDLDFLMEVARGHEGTAETLKVELAVREQYAKDTVALRAKREAEVEPEEFKGSVTEDGKLKGIVETDKGRVYQELDSEGKVKAKRFIVELNTGETVVFKGQANAKEALKTGSTEGNVGVYGGAKRLTSDIVQELGELTEPEVALRDILVEQYELEGEDVANVGSLIQENREGTAKEYTLENIRNQGKIVERREVKSKESKRARAEGISVADSIGMATAEELDLTEAVSIRQEEGELDLLEAEDITAEKATAVPSPADVTVTPPKMRFKRASDAQIKKDPSKQKDHFYAEGTDRNLEIRTISRRAGKVTTVTSSLYEDGKKIGSFPNPMEAAQSVGGTFGNTEFSIHQPGNATQLELDEDSQAMHDVPNGLAAVLLVKQNGTKQQQALATMLHRALGAETLYGVSFKPYDGMVQSRFTGTEVILGSATLQKKYYQTMLHELVHGLTSAKVKSNPVMNDRIESMRQESLEKLDEGTQAAYAQMEGKNSMEILEIYQEVIADHGRDAFMMAYSHINNTEFLGNAMDNKKFQEHLKSIPVDKPTGVVKSLWDKFVVGIRGALGMGDLSYNMFDKVLSTTTDIASNDYELMFHGQSAEYATPSISKSELGVHMTPERDLAEGFTDDEGIIKEFKITSDEVLELKDQGSWDDTILTQLHKVLPNEKWQDLSNDIDGLTEYTQEESEKMMSLIREALLSEGYKVVKYTNRYEYGKGQSLHSRVNEVDPMLNWREREDVITQSTDEYLQERYGAKDSYIILDPTAVQGDEIDLSMEGEITESLMEKTKREIAETTNLVEREALRGKFEDLKGRTADWLKRKLQGGTEVLRAIHPKLEKIMTQFEAMVNMKSANRLERLAPYIVSVRALPDDVRKLYNITLMNTNSSRALEEKKNIEKTYGIDYKPVQKVLDEIAKEMVRTGLLNKTKENYFPNVVQDINGLMDHLSGDKPELTNTIRKALIAKGVKEPTVDDIKRAYEDAMVTGRYPAMLSIPGSAKKRTINQVDLGMSQYYRDPMEALQLAVQSNTEAVEQRNVIGKSNRASLEKDLENATGQKAVDILAQLNNLEGLTEESISGWVAKKAIAGNLPREDQQLIKDVFKARFNQVGVSKGMKKVKDVQLMIALGTPMSTVTQLGDAPLIANRYGFGNMIKALGKVISGEETIQGDVFDFSNALKELEEGNIDNTGKWLDRVLEMTGFKKLDFALKRAAMEASLENARGMSREEFGDKYGEVYDGPGEADRLYNEINSGQPTEAVKLFAFNELSGLQPISTSSMPIQYMEGGNWRLAYALKSFGLKQINSIYRDTMEAKTKPEALKAMAAGIITLTLAGAGTDCIKNLMQGKYCDPGEEVIDNFLKIGMTSRYAMGGISQDGVDGVLADMFMPPMDLINRPIADMMSWLDSDGEGEFTTAKNIPVLGSFLYENLSQEAYERHEKQREEWERGI